jgi:hypothetical protein
MIVGFEGRLTNGAKDIELLVLSVHMDANPPCIAITDWNWKRPQRFAGGYASIGEVFDDAVKDAIKKHPGYTMEKRWRVEIPDPSIIQESDGRNGTVEYHDRHVIAITGG